MKVIDSKDLVMHLNCGPKNLKLAPMYILFKDFNIGKFVLVRPHDLVLVWMKRTQSDVKDDQNEFQNVKGLVVGVPMKKGSNLDDNIYENYCNGK